MNTGPTIIPVASGKGGIGKTFLTANLAIALAEMGRQTVAVDLDLGGSNLNMFLGIPNKYPGIGDFLKARVPRLDKLLVPTATKNLHLLPGDGKTPFMANLHHAQKIKLIRHIRELPADYMLLDLGAGSTFNTLDFFGIAPMGMLVTSPEYPAIMGMLVFLKNYLLRAMDRQFSKHRLYGAREIFQTLCKRPMDEQMQSLKSVTQEIEAEDPEAAEKINGVLKICRPRIVFNMGRHPDDLKVTAKINESLKEILAIEPDYFGFVFNDPEVAKSIENHQAYLPYARDAMAARNIVRTAERIDKYWERPIQDSARLLTKSVLKEFDDQ